MQRGALIVAVALLLVPSFAFGATTRAERSLLVSTPTTDNGYYAGGIVEITAPAAADILATGGTVAISAAVAGDAILAGGTVATRRPIAGDLRAAAGRIMVEDTVGGDIAALGGVVTVSAPAHDMRIVGGTVNVTDGADGYVIIYGVNVFIAGEFTSSVKVVASDHLTLGEGTHIAGTLEYNAPQEAFVPESAVVDSGIAYTGSATFLPTNEEAKTFALAGAGIFLVVRVLAAVLAAGLMAGLFPVLARNVTDRVLGRSLKRFVLLALAGFAYVVATPILIVLLAASFVGIGIALIILALYFLLLILSYLYAGVIAGNVIVRTFWKRDSVSWRTAVLGMLALGLIGILPGIGVLSTFVLLFVATGALASAAYSYAFGSSLADDLYDGSA